MYKQSEFGYEIVRHIATLSTSGDCSKELNLVSYRGAAPKYDLRTWRRLDGAEQLLKGVTLNEDEMDALREAINAL